MRLRPTVLTVSLAAFALPAFAETETHGEGGFLAGLMYSLKDPVTHTAFAAFVVFLFIAHRMGAFKAALSALDNRADKIRSELEQAASLREQAAQVLALAEQRAQDADREAETLIEQAKQDAKRIMEDARKDMAEKLARREAQAVARIARAEADASSEVRRAAADAATTAVRQVLASSNQDDAFNRAATELERALKR